MEAKGRSGTIEFDGSTVTIRREGFLARATVGKGEKRIPVGSITAVQWKPAGMATNGFIQFTVPGGNEARSQFGRQTADAARDENSVVFTKPQTKDFEAIRAAIEAAVSAARSPAPAPAPAATGAEQVAQLAQLHAAGALTDAEFAAAKAKALGL